MTRIAPAPSRVDTALAATREPHSPIPFRERVHALAGHTTFREPAGGRSTEQKPIPADHMIAAALSFGRQSHDDIGPDIAFDIATGAPSHQRRVLAWLGAQLSGLATHAADGYGPARRCSSHLGLAAVYAYNAIVRGYFCPPPPQGVRERDWQELLLFACLLLEQAAEDALALASRRARAA
jgi:hypothetical protein